MTKKPVRNSGKKKTAANQPREQSKPGDDQVIVAIGASAGGLEALRSLLPTLPLHKNLTYVIAQHMDPKHSSMLSEILNRDTDMKVSEVKDGQKLLSGFLYVIPPGMDACTVEKRIRLEPATEIGPKPSINRFFISLAKEFQSRVVGIILSGTGTDGAHGIYAIKAEGGITIAQKESTAKFNSMPHAAIDTGHVDLILSPETIGQQLPDLIQFPRVLLPPDEEEGRFSPVFRMMLDHTGSDFRNYKKNTIRRRMERRMAVNKVASLDEYIALLKKTPGELNELHKDFLISVTAFFRDGEPFDELKDILNQAIRKNSKKRSLRIWIAGCATGEEAFSVAILLSELLGQRVKSFNINIFATDLDEDALAFARQGIYPKTAVEEIDEKIRKKYFQREGEGYRLIPEIRDMILFARHDLVKDPPFSHVDLISCRNVLIYFNNNLQKHVFQSFHYALEPEGTLFLGKSETTGVSEKLFQEVDRSSRIYQRSSAVASHLPHFNPLRGNGKQAEFTTGNEEVVKATPTDNLNNMLASVYQPDCVLLDDRLEVTYLRGNLNELLMLPEGRAALSILDLIHTEIRHDLRGLLYKAQREDQAVRSRKIRLLLNDRPTQITLAARYFSSNVNSAGKFILIFEQENLNKDEADLLQGNQEVSSLRVKQLEEELRETKESLQTTIEELETTNEELQSTYEEAQSTNEELFTSSEELQTTNEELQSTNEELRTVNQELSVKGTEVEPANDQLKLINLQLADEVHDRRLADEKLQVANEELQSSNEELSNVNQELKVKRDELESANEQMKLVNLQLAEEVDERRVAEEKLRTIFDSEPAWINLCKLDGTIMQLNKIGLKMMEAESSKDLVGKKLEDFASGLSAEVISQCKTKLKPGIPYSAEIEVKTLKGNRRCLEVNAVLLPGMDGEDQQLMSIVLDSTARKQAQEQVAQKQTELARVMRRNTMGEMASRLAHELNQPLSAINNYVNGCVHRIDNDSCSRQDILDVLKLASTQAQRAGEIINQVKNYISQDDSKTENLDINQVIENAILIIKASGGNSSIEWKTSLGRDLPPVKVNEVQIEQVLINLVLNAIESMEESKTAKSKLTISSRKVNGDQQVRVSVKDEGVGLPDGEDFYQQFYTTKQDGMGMGLSISRSIIEAHDGEIKARNNKNNGATFSFTLPESSDVN